jgi:uncharacterized hydrophobic protein (TIGR00271 family)
LLILLHSADDAQTVKDDVLPLFAETPTKPVEFDLENLPEVEDGSTIACFLSDADLRLLIPEASARRWRLGLLPHPEMRSARSGLGIASKLADAATDILETTDEIDVDILRCNERVVLNSLVIGDPIATAPALGSGDGIGQRVRRLWRTLAFLTHTPPMRCTIESAKGQSVETAVLGVVVVEHGRSAVLSRRLIEDSALADGMLHCLIYAPRSILMMLWFTLRSALSSRSTSAKSLPSFVGHIKSESLAIKLQRPARASIDGERLEADEFTLSVDKGGLLLIPGRHLTLDTTAPDPKDVFRTKGVPTGDIIDTLSKRHLPWINRATTEEFRELFLILRDNARATESFVVLMVLSTMLAALGLFADSGPVIIGAMILAPLMAPIVALAMGVLRTSEKELLRNSLRSLAIGIGLALACTIVLTLLTPLRTINSEIGARLNPTILDMGIAMISGAAGAYAHARAEIAKSLAGVAIAVALVPPLAVAGIGLGWGEPSVFLGAGLLFLTNLAGMTLAAAGVFLLMGYSPFTYSRRGVLTLVVFALIVTALLVPSFAKMITEHRVLRALDGWESPSGVMVREIDISHGEPVRVSARLIDDDPIGTERLDEIKREIEERLGFEIELEARLGVLRR